MKSQKRIQFGIQKKSLDVDEVVEEARAQVQKSQGGIHLEFKKLQTGW